MIKMVKCMSFVFFYKYIYLLYFIIINIVLFIINMIINIIIIVIIIIKLEIAYKIYMRKILTIYELHFLVDFKFKIMILVTSIDPTSVPGRQWINVMLAGACEITTRVMLPSIISIRFALIISSLLSLLSVINYTVYTKHVYLNAK